MTPKSILVFIFLLTGLLFLPIFLNVNLFLNRSNDLQEQFWPVFYYIKQQVLTNHTLPLWNNLWFSGMPLLPDPQFPLFYPFTILFIILPTNLAFITSLIIHIILGGIGMYLCVRKAFGLSKMAGAFTAMLYVSSPKLAGFLEAGHPGLVYTAAWIPFALLALVLLFKTPGVKWGILLAVSLAGIFYSHTIILILVVTAGIPLAIYLSILYSRSSVNAQRKKLRQSLVILFIAGGLTFGLTAITLLPQLEWLPHTTRFLLLQGQDVYPKWEFPFELLKVTFIPWINGWQFMQNIDSEKWLAIGILPAIFAIIGFLRASKKSKIMISLALFISIILALNNASPFYNLLLKQEWYLLIRVTTRIWFIPSIITVILAGYGLEKFLKYKPKKYLVIMGVTLALLESLLLSWSRLTKPILTQSQYVPSGLYEFLAKDQERFRVFCLTRCISQKEAAKYNLELVEGYNTLQQTNYYKHMWQLTGQYWNYYTLSLPPVGTYTFEKIQPDVISLGEFNVKYVISPHKLNDKNFELKKETGGYLIYQNMYVYPRAYFWTDEQKPGGEAPILQYTPNFIRVDTSKHETSRLVLAEVWSPGWNAYLDGNKKTAVQERPNTLRQVDITSDTKFVDFVYEPKSYNIGKTITFVTLITLAGILLCLWKVFSNLPRKRNFF